MILYSLVLTVIFNTDQGIIPMSTVMSDGLSSTQCQVASKSIIDKSKEYYDKGLIYTDVVCVATGEDVEH